MKLTRQKGAILAQLLREEKSRLELYEHKAKEHGKCHAIIWGKREQLRLNLVNELLVQVDNYTAQRRHYDDKTPPKTPEQRHSERYTKRIYLADLKRRGLL